MGPNDPRYDLAREHKILREGSPISQIIPSLQRIYWASLEMPRTFLPACPKSLAIFDHHCCRFYILFQFITRGYKWETRKVEIISHLYKIFEIAAGSSIQSQLKDGVKAPIPNSQASSSQLQIARGSP